MVDPKICKDCRHCFIKSSRLPVWYDYLCSRPNGGHVGKGVVETGVDLVTGGKVKLERHCRDERQKLYEGSCGPDGLYWERKSLLARLDTRT